MANRAALLRAENAGKTVTRRGRHFIEFDEGGGTRRFVTTIDPLHVRDSETEIDATWAADTGAWQWKIAAADYQFHARSVFNVGSLVEWRMGEEWVIVDPQSINWVNQDNSRQQIAIKQAVTGTANDATLTFANAYGTGRHFSYTAHPKQLIKHITIDSAANLPTPTVTGTIWFEAEWTITNSVGVKLYLDGVRWARTNNVRVRTSSQIEFRSLATGEVLWYADAPTATDANGETITAQYEVMRSGKVYFIRVRVPREWLLSAAYPVAIDPTLTDGYGGDVTTAKDDLLYNSAPTYNYGAYLHLVNIYTNRGLIEFDISSIAATATCDSATLYIYKSTTTGGSTNVPYNFYSIASGNAAWIEGTKNNAQAGSGEPCWNALAADGSGGVTTAWAGSAGCSTSGTDFEASAIGSLTANTGDAEGTEYTAALNTTRVAGWFGASNTNYGVLAIVSSGTVSAPIGSSDNSTTGYRPKLVVVYTEAGGGDPEGSLIGGKLLRGGLLMHGVLVRG